MRIAAVNQKSHPSVSLLHRSTIDRQWNARSDREPHHRPHDPHVRMIADPICHPPAELLSSFRRRRREHLHLTDWARHHHALNSEFDDHVPRFKVVHHHLQSAVKIIRLPCRSFVFRPLMRAQISRPPFFYVRAKPSADVKAFTGWVLSPDSNKSRFRPTSPDASLAPAAQSE